MVKAVIFDMDGVLIDSHDIWFEVFNKALEHFEKKHITLEEFDKSVWAADFDKTVKHYFTIKKETIREYFDSQQDTFYSNLNIFTDIKDTLKKLKEKGLKLAVATNTHTSLAIKMLKRAGISEFFEHIIGGDQVAHGKPAPDILLKVIHDMNIKKSESIYLGDTYWDRMAAEDAGIRFIGVRLKKKENINSLSEILDKLR